MDSTAMAMACDVKTGQEKFFDTRDEVLSTSSLSPDCSEDCLSSGVGNCALDYEFWTKKPASVCERRDKFLRWMDLSSHWDKVCVDDEDLLYADTERDIDGNGGVVGSNLDSEMEFFSSRSLQYFQSCDSAYLLEDDVADENLTGKIRNLDNGTEYVVDGFGDDGSVTTFRQVGSNKMITLDQLQKAFGSSLLVQQLFKKDHKGFNIIDSMKKEKQSWLQRFNIMSEIVSRAKELLVKPESNPKTGCTSQKVNVNVCKKNLKELSSIYTGQEFPAHEGSILTMKFSPDGQYLASAGEDGVVRVWKVLEDDAVNKYSNQNIDPSCLYFSLNHTSKLASLHAAKERTDDMKSSKKSSDSVCVVLPPKVFQLSEKPFHEFHGHQGEVLALSWSKNGHLLSSSVDKTARMWSIGHDHCLGVYSHSNYVTCVEFNPVNDNHFISGSIDGKLRIWNVEGGRVIDWIDIKEIVTAVCYGPEGNGGIIGFIDGHCQYFDVIDNRVQLGAQIRLKGKKKLPGKRITGFQYCPSDPSRVMVTSADSKVQILCGTNVVCKFKGNRNSVSQGPASFTSDGEHVVLASEDSDIRVWTYPTQNQTPCRPKKKKNVWSCERFWSRNASIAIPWCGLKNRLGALPGSILRNGHLDDRLGLKFPVSCLTSSLGSFLDGLYKGSSTWPEERLMLKSIPIPIKPPPLLHKSEFKFLKNAWHSAFNAPHSWGLVVVTAGWDGCIRTFLNYGLPIRF